MQELLTLPETESAAALAEMIPPVAAPPLPVRQAELPVLAKPVRMSGSELGTFGMMVRALALLPLLTLAVGLIAFGFLPVVIAGGVLLAPVAALFLGAGLGIVLADAAEEPAESADSYQ